MDRSALWIVIALGLFGCGAATEDADYGSASAAVIGGSPDQAHPGVIVVRNPQGTCTGTLLAPDLVMTARHCVAVKGTSTTRCSDPAQPNVGAMVPVYTGDQPPANLEVDSTRQSSALAHAKRIFDDGASSGCGHDVAFLLLDTQLSLPTSQVRRTAPQANEQITVVGWGETDDAHTPATQRMAASANVLTIGPTLFDFQPNGDTSAQPVTEAVPDGEFLITRDTTAAGDSGAPAFDAGGLILGIVARGFTMPAYGPTHMTTLASHLDVLDMALAASSAGTTTPDAGSAASDAGQSTVDAGSHPSDGGLVWNTGGDGGGSSSESQGPSSGGETKTGCSTAGVGCWMGAGLLVAVLRRRRTT